MLHIICTISYSDFLQKRRTIVHDFPLGVNTVTLWKSQLIRYPNPIGFLPKNRRRSYGLILGNWNWDSQSSQQEIILLLLLFGHTLIKWVINCTRGYKENQCTKVIVSLVIIIIFHLFTRWSSRQSSNLWIFHQLHFIFWIFEIIFGTEIWFFRKIHVK